MRITGRRLGAAFAALLLVIAAALGVIAYVRWKSAGSAHAITPPPGATVPADGFDLDVVNRSGIVALRMRNDRGKPTVRTYEVPSGSPWLQSRKIVATQLDHWEQLGDCADNPDATIVECAWREPTRWWPREVSLTMLRLPPATDNDAGRTYVIIGSAPGA